MIKLVFGQETLLARRFLEGIKADLAATHSLSVIDCSKEDFETVQASLAAPSLFSLKALFLFFNPFSSPSFLSQLEEASELFKNSSNAFVFFQEGEVSKGTAFFRFLKKNAEIHVFEKLSFAEQLKFVSKEAARYGMEMSREVTEEVVRRAPNDLWRIEKEMQKLAAFKGRAPRTAARKDVTLLLKEEVVVEIFAMLGALARKERKKATELLAQHLALGQAPLYLFSMILYQLRLLLLVKDLQERNTPVQDMATILHAHPYAVKKAGEAAHNFSLAELQELYKRAFSLDVALKTGKGDPEQLLYLFLGQAAARKNSTF